MSRARACDHHRPASFGDGQVAGPAITDVGALLGRGALRKRETIASLLLECNVSGDSEQIRTLLLRILLNNEKLSNVVTKDSKHGHGGVCEVACRSWSS